MATVYINLHPNYPYATAIIGEGYVAIRDYVQLVDWLGWDIGNKRQLMISGTMGDREKAKIEHMERAAVFAERMTSFGCKVLMRNERGEEWREFESHGFSEAEMLDVEYQLFHEPDKWRWARQNIEKYQKYVDVAKERGTPEQIALFEEVLAENVEQLECYKEEEAQRKKAIEDFWETKRARKRWEEEWERKLDEVMAKKYQNEQAARKGESS